MAKKKAKNNQLANERRDKFVCGNCGLSNGYPRLKTQEWICRSCGHTTSIKKKESKE